MEYTQEQIDAAALAGMSVEEFVAAQATPAAEETVEVSEAAEATEEAAEEAVA